MRLLHKSDAAALLKRTSASADETPLKSVLGGPAHAEAARLLPTRKRTDTKHDAGEALIFAGSWQYPGAALLAVSSCARSGVGYVKAIVPERIRNLLLANSPGAIALTDPRAEECLSPFNLSALPRPLRSGTATLVGPGIGTAPPTKDFVGKLLEHYAGGRSQIVLDADALNLLAADNKLARGLKDNLILTPHAGEMARLLNRTKSEIEGDRLGAAVRAAETFGAVVVLKGPSTIITDGQFVRIAPWRTSGLAKAGSGDVLAGLMAGLLAQMHDRPFEAAALAVYVHGLAGALAIEAAGEFAVTPSDIIGHLGGAFLLFN